MLLAPVFLRYAKKKNKLTTVKMFLVDKIGDDCYNGKEIRSIYEREIQRNGNVLRGVRGRD